MGTGKTFRGKTNVRRILQSIRFYSQTKKKGTNILLAHCLLKKIVTDMIMLYKRAKPMVCSIDGDTNCDIIAGSC